jgi:Tol biopolymer transport system component
VQGNAESTNSSISADGRLVAFDSAASNLVPGDTNGRPDAFVHDRATGTTSCVSVDSDRVPRGGAGPSISADGRFVAFWSFSPDLVHGDRNGTFDVFVHDRATGVTSLVSVDSSGVQGNGSSGGASISVDGRFVAFSSRASNLVLEDTNGWQDVFVHDRASGTVTRVSVGSAGMEGDHESHSPSISADGGFVAFESAASDLVSGDSNRTEDAFVHDRALVRVERVVPANGSEAGGEFVAIDGEHFTGNEPTEAVFGVAAAAIVDLNANRMGVATPGRRASSLER